jgi:hypothetical protein
VQDVAQLEVGLDRDVFLRTVLRELSGALEAVIGLEDASGYISLVGGAVGDSLNTRYKQALQVDRLDRAQVGAVLTDLKRRIRGEFRVAEETPDRIVLVNTRCPFGEQVLGRPSLCMMTSNVFGAIAAENLGYARVRIEQALARGDAACRVVVALRPGPPEEGAREYFQAAE